MARRFAAAKVRTRPTPASDPREFHQFEGSSWVNRAWYRDLEQVVVIEFNDGHRHMYRDVDRETWDAFTRSAHPGRFVHAELDVRPHRAV